MAITAEQARAELERRRMADAARAELERRQSQQPTPAPQPSTFEDMFAANVLDPNTPDPVIENVIGRGEADTPGEKLGQMIRGGGAATARGIADVPALPVNLAQLGAAGYEKLTGAEEPTAFSRALNSLPDTRDMLASVPVIGPESEYVAPGTSGQYIKNAGEFAGGAGAMGGVNSMVRYGVLPGLTSEAAGQATEGTPYEPYARTGSAVLTSLLATPRNTGYTRGADPDDLATANRLEAAGVRPTAGQVSNSDRLMRAEGSTSPLPSQMDDFTAAAMRTTGSTSPRATPQALARTQDAITDGMNDILENVDVPVSTGIGQRVTDIASDYAESTAGKMPSVNLRRISDEIMDAATSPNASTIPATTLREWRTRLGKMTTSTDEAVRDMAHELRSVIDDVTEAQLSALGRTEDVARLGELRNQYRNFLTVADASTKGGREGARGVLSPERLSTAATRTVGKTNYALGRGSDVTGLARDGLGMIGSTPTVRSDGLRRIAGAGNIGGAALAGGAGLQAGLDPVTIALMAAGGSAAPIVGQQLMRSNMVQTLLNNPSRLAGQQMRVLPGALQESVNALNGTR